MVLSKTYCPLAGFIPSIRWLVEDWGLIDDDDCDDELVKTKETHFKDCLKAVDTIGNCQRLAFTVGVSQHMHKITNLWKFELNRSSKLRDNNERRKHPCHTKLCAFRWLISRPQVLNLRSRNQIRGKLLLSPKLWHFRGSCFSQCFIPPTSPHYLSPRKVLC